jgi:dolichyl-phosphate beta-glucosyltransferase
MYTILYSYYGDKKIILKEAEYKYYDPLGEKLDQLLDNSQVDISIVIPAYNEEKRIPSTLEEIHHYMEHHCKWATSYEILIVDDGSKDKTITVVEDFVHRTQSPHVRLLKLKSNRGKGGALIRGVLMARGRILLMADADNATQFSDIEKLISTFKQKDMETIMNEIRWQML